MNKIGKLVAPVLALSMAFTLAACGGTTENPPATSTPAQTSAPAPTSAPAEIQAGNAAASIAGNYKFNYTDIYGDISAFTVTIKDGGAFNIMTQGALGNAVYSGSEWTDNGDGSFTTGATDQPLEVEFVADDGSVTWIIDGSNVTPAGYTEPTEFIEKASVSDPATAAEAVGIYLFGEVNDHGSTVPYALWVNADGSYSIFMNNSFTGLHEYSGDSWSINSESVLSCGPAAFEGDEPMGTWFDAENGFSSAYVLRGDGTFVPVGYTGSQAPVSAENFTGDAAYVYPAGGEYVGVYTFGEINDHGSTVPYVLWVNADGTANIYMNNSFTGLHEYDGEWAYEGDGVISVTDLTFEGDEPMGTWFDADNGFDSSYTLNADGTFAPVGYTGSSTKVDTAALPAEIYPTATSLAGVYYFGEVNDHGSTVPYALVLKDDGSALIVMDNHFTGVHTYTGAWTETGDGVVSVGALAFEGDEPMGSWFDAENGFASSYTLSAGKFVPVGYTGSQAAVSAGDLSDGAAAAVNDF